MTEMMLKWNEKEKCYGCVWNGKWYRRRLQAQQELKLNDVETTLQFDRSRMSNHGWYLYDYPDQGIDGLKVDLPFDPLVVRNIVY
jgi:hypothetical protein